LLLLVALAPEVFLVSSNCFIFVNDVPLFFYSANYIFRYWKDPGPFVDGGLGFVSVLLSAGFSFQGTEVGKFIFIFIFFILCE
jgi:amino acid permease